MKRLLCAATALALFVSCLVSCGKTENQTENSKADSSKETTIEKVTYDQQINKNPVDKLLDDSSPLLGYWTGENGCMYIECNEFGEEGFTVFLYQGYDNSVKVFSAQTGSFDGSVENITYKFNTDGEFYEQYDLCNVNSSFSFSINDDNSIYVSCDGDNLIRYTKKDIDKSMFDKFAGNWRLSESDIYEVKYDTTMQCPDIAAVAKGFGFSDECDILLSKQDNEYAILNIGKDKGDNTLISTEITDNGKITSMYLDYTFIRCYEDTLSIAYNKGAESTTPLSRVKDTSSSDYDLVGKDSPLLGYWNCDTANMYIEYNEFGDEGFTLFFYNGLEISEEYSNHACPFEVFCSKLGTFEYSTDTKAFTYNLDTAYADDSNSEITVYNKTSDFSFAVSDDNSTITVLSAGNSFEMTRETASIDDYSTFAGEWKYNESYSDKKQFATIDIDEKTGEIIVSKDDLGYLSILKNEDLHFYNKEKKEYVFINISKDALGNDKNLIYKSDLTTQIALDIVKFSTEEKDSKLKITDTPIFFPSSGQVFEFDRVGSSGAVGELNFNKILGKKYSDDTVITFLQNFFDKNAEKSDDGEFFVGNYNMWKAGFSFDCKACKVIVDKDNVIKEIRFYYCNPKSPSEKDLNDMFTAYRYMIGEYKKYNRAIPQDDDFEDTHDHYDHFESYTEELSSKVDRKVFSHGWDNYLGGNMVYQEARYYELPLNFAEGYLTCCVSFRDTDVPFVKEGESFFEGYKDPYGYDQ